MRYRFYREHKYVSSALNDLERQIAKTNFRSLDEIEKIKNEFEAIVEMLKSHAHYENSALHELLRKKQSSIYVHIEKDHQHYDTLLDDLFVKLKKIFIEQNEEERVESGYQFYLWYRKFVGENLLHLHEEETVILPELQRLYTDIELKAVEANTYHRMTPTEMIHMMQVLFPHMNLDDKVAFLTDIKESQLEKFMHAWIGIQSELVAKERAVLVSSLSLFAHQGQIGAINNINIWYETFGEKENPALLLIMGGCCQGVIWHQAFCEKLASEGFSVIRYDHRDAGLSTCFDFAKNPYTSMDMVKDAVGVLDAACVQKAHVFGLSMGSWIAELMAVYFPERVKTLLLMGSTCEIRPMNRAYADLPLEESTIFPPPASHYLEWMKEFMKLSPLSDEEKLAHRLEGWNKLNGQKTPLNEITNREIHKEFLSRLRYPQGLVNHITMLNNEHTETLVRSAPSKIKIPTVILHGSEDPIFSPAHGEALHKMIENSKYLLVEGMGHVPNDHFYDLYIDILKRQASEMLAKNCRV